MFKYAIFLIFIIILKETLSQQDDYNYEEHATVQEILKYLSQLKTNKDIEVLYIPLKDQSYLLQDFMKLKDEAFFNIYNHNKSQVLLLNDMMQDYTNFSKKIANPFSITVNNMNIMNFKSFKELSYYQEIDIFESLKIKESVNFHSNEEISLFQIEDFYKDDKFDNEELIHYMRSLAQQRYSFFHFLVFEIETDQIFFQKSDWQIRSYELSIKNINITIFYYNDVDGKLFIWTFLNIFQVELAVFHENLCEMIYQRFFEISERLFSENTHPLHKYRSQEYKIYSNFKNLISELSQIFRETLPTRLIEKNSFSEIFVLRANLELQAIWKNIKNNIILALTSLELAQFKSTNQQIMNIYEKDLKNLRNFLRINTENQLDLKAPRFWVSKYIFSLVIGVGLCVITGWLVYKSPKLQNKKFV